ncbi:MAG: DinB family protein, partial [Gemmatimonas sp.]
AVGGGRWAVGGSNIVLQRRRAARLYADVPTARRTPLLHRVHISDIASHPHPREPGFHMNYYGAKQLAESWRTVRKNTIQVAEEIPEEQYGFRASADTMTVGEQLAHMATSPLWAVLMIFEEKKDTVAAEDFPRYVGYSGKAAAALTSKRATVDALRSNGDDLASRLEGVTEDELAGTVTMPNGSKSRFEILLGLKEHEMHHRAQLMLIQRMIGIVPHLTRARMERMAATR